MNREPLPAGKPAPDFCIPDAYEEDLCLKGYRGMWVVLYFYPKDNTPGCSLEAADYSTLKEDFEKAQTVILGVSRDSCKSHQNFIDKKRLTITLLSDPDLKVQRMYGVRAPRKFMGKEYIGTRRTTFLIDPEGMIARVWTDVKVKGHAKEVLEDVRKRRL